MYKWLKKYINPVIPLYGIIPLLSCFALNMLVYSGTMILCADWKHYDLTTSFDKMVPLVPEWMYIYFGCYLFWVVNYILVARIYRDDKARFYRFVITDMMSRLVCAAFYIGFPTTNIRPDVTGGGFSESMLTFCTALTSLPICFLPYIAWSAGCALQGSGKAKKYRQDIRSFPVFLLCW